MDWKRRLRFGALLAAVPLVPAVAWYENLIPGFRNDPKPMSIEVDLSKRQLIVRENGDVTETFGIAVGRPSHPTPTGSFRTGDIDWNPAWRPPPVDWAKHKHYEAPGAPTNPMQGVKIYFEAPYYFIHGTNNPDSIGEAASHGCIRMTADDAVALAHMIENAGGGVPIEIHE